jgi:hypothetical protein
LIVAHCGDSQEPGHPLSRFQRDDDDSSCTAFAPLRRQRCTVTG